jgi:hypothetical protein
MVTVTFEFEPEQPDPDDRTGMSDEEYEDLTGRLMELGATDIKIVRKD